MNETSTDQALAKAAAVGNGRVAGKKALVTGAAQGLGEAISRMLAREGAQVSLTDRNVEGAQKIADAINAQFPGRALALRHDVTSQDDWEAVLKAHDDHFHGLNILVNNAGIGTMGSIEDESLDRFRHVYAVDVESIFIGCKLALPYMHPHGLGSIVNISSIAGLIAAHNYVSYNTAKAAVWMISKSVALHCAKKGGQIRCNSVHPTFIQTPILDGIMALYGPDEGYRKLSRQVPLGRLGEPDDVAYLVLYLASDESKFVTAAEFKVDGGISAQ